MSTVVPWWLSAREHVEQLGGALAVLAEGGLIEGEHGGAGDEGGADREAALLPAGEQERMLVAQLLEPEAAQHAHRGVGAIGLGDAVHAQAELELAERAVRDELVLGVLEHEADAARERSRIGAGGVEAEHVDGSGGRRDDAGDRLQQRGLARAVGADDRDEVARGDVEVDLVHDDRPPPAAPPHRESPNPDRRIARARVALDRGCRSGERRAGRRVRSRVRRG